MGYPRAVAGANSERTQGRPRLGFLASHRGSNVRAIVKACQAGRLHATAAVVVSNNSDAPVLEYAREQGIATAHLSSSTHPDEDDLDRAILSALVDQRVDLVLLVGYLKLLGPRTLEAFERRILNTHPALLPKHGGKGMFGSKVHEAVLAAGETETGVTIHLASSAYDEGAVVAQRRVAVEPGDTVDSLAARVLAVEHEFVVEALGEIVAGMHPAVRWPPN